MPGMPGEKKVVYRSVRVKVEYQSNAKFWRKLAVGKLMRFAVMDMAERVAKPYAVSISPRSNINHQHYQDSFVVETVMTGLTPPESIGNPPMLRVGARLWNTVGHAAAIEWGNWAHPRGHHVLGKTLAYLNSRGHESA